MLLSPAVYEFWASQGYKVSPCLKDKRVGNGSVLKSTKSSSRGLEFNFHSGSQPSIMESDPLAGHGDGRTPLIPALLSSKLAWSTK